MEKALDSGDVVDGVDQLDLSLVLSVVHLEQVVYSSSIKDIHKISELFFKKYILKRISVFQSFD